MFFYYFSFFLYFTQDIELTIRLLISLPFCQLNCMNIISKKAIKSMFCTNPGFAHFPHTKKRTAEAIRLFHSANDQYQFWAAISSFTT